MKLMNFRSFRRGVRQALAGCAGCAGARRRLLLLLALLALGALLYSAADSRFKREEMLTIKLGAMANELEFLISSYRARHEEVIALQMELRKNEPEPEPLVPEPEVAALLKTLNDSRLWEGMRTRRLRGAPFVPQLLPHLLGAPLRPAFHLRARLNHSEFVLGVPTVRRDKEDYLLITLEHLVAGLRQLEGAATVVVCVGETDLGYVLRVAHGILAKFPKQVESGMIEVISPALSFYPDLSRGRANLGDSRRRFHWRTKQNLDAIFLMAYALTRGTYYLMLEDDVIATPTYMDAMKKYTREVSVSNPDWVFIDYCSVGGIGKLFKMATLKPFVMYVELFYQNMPIDWLLEKYLEDLECPLYQNAEGAGGGGGLPRFHPHANPPLASATSTIRTHQHWTLAAAYAGNDFFWGIKPKRGDYIEFWFKEPTYIKSYLFRSGNVDHISDRFQNTIIEIVPARGGGGLNATVVGAFDEFGLAEGALARDAGPAQAVRLRVLQDHTTWVVLSEISLVPYDDRNPVSEQSELLTTRTRKSAGETTMSASSP